MASSVVLENFYRKIIKNLPAAIPDGILSIDLQALYMLGLLSCKTFDQPTGEEALPQRFCIIETAEKVTLFNAQFVVWVVPQQRDKQTTVVMIALLSQGIPKLEIVYTTSGIYNSANYILKILQHLLKEMQDTEEALALLQLR